MNYGDLKAHFNDLLNRSDITSSLTTRFIDQGISRIQRQLRTPLNEKSKTYTITASTSELVLPTDFLEIISLYSSEYELRRTTMSEYRALANNAYTGKPQVFVREQEKLKLFPQPTSGSVTLYYYGEFDAMSADSDENKLAQVAPDLIIYAGLSYGADFYLDERASLFEQKYQAFLSEIQEQANDQELNGGTQSIRPAYGYRDYD
jgi:hypothetical protein